MKRNRRWSQKLRQVERVLLSMLIVVAGLAMLYGLYRLVFLGDSFSLERIVVEGDLRHLSADGVASLSGARKGDNLFWTPVSQIYDRLSRDPWVKEAAVRRRLPDELSIYIVEYKPVAMVAANGLRFVDAAGTVVKEVEGGEDHDLAVISGLSIGEAGQFEGKELGRLKEAIALIADFEATGYGKAQGVAEAHYDEVSGWSIFTRRDPVQIVVGDSELAARVEKIDRLAGSIAARGGRIQYMIANEEGRIIVRYRPA